MDWTAASIRALRETLRLDQADFAAQLGAGTRTVQSWEAGDSLPNAAARRNLDQLQASVTPSAPRPLKPRLDEATWMELMAEVMERFAAAERVVARADTAAVPLDTPTTIRGPVMDR